MARLGEQLIASGVVSADKVEQALRAQVVWGGRLGTNLIELGAIALDDLSRALGQQHGVASALGRHFEKADPALQALLPISVAKQFCVVPLVRLTPQCIAVVALDPLSDAALDALAEIYGVDPIDGIVTSVAAELRVLYHLERVYKLARPTRYLRTKGASITPFPTFDLSFELDIEVEPEIVDELAPIPDIDVEVELEEVTTLAPVRRPSGSMPPISVDDVAAMLDHAIATTADQEGPSGRERRTYLRTLADDVGPAAPAPSVVQIPPRPPIKTVSIPPLAPPAAVIAPVAPSVPPAPSAYDAPTVSAPLATAEALRASLELATAEAAPVVARTATGSAPIGALGRIAIKRVVVATASDPLLAPTNFLDATRAIKRGPHRDRVAELVIETLDRHVPSCAAGLLLVIRGDVAIGWKHFSRADDGTSEVAVPLGEDGVVPSAITSRTSTRCAADDLGPIDGLLLRAVGNGTDGELVVVPISIGDQVMCVLAVATDVDAELGPLEAIAAAAGAAFTRLIRDASR